MMNNSTSHFQLISDILRDVGTPECLKKVTELEKNSTNRNSYHFRNLGLNPKDVFNICDVILKEYSLSINSISFSYNQKFGDNGASILAKFLPLSIQEIGLVDCGISNKGGLDILDWVKRASNLKMICIEQNNFTQNLKTEFHKFAKDNPKILILV